MNPCDSILADLDAFRDGVLDENHRIQIQQHLKNCTACNEEMTRSADIEQALKEHASSWIPSENLWPRIQHSASQLESSQSSSPKHYFSQFKWMAAALILLTVTVFSFNMVRHDDQSLTNPVATALVNEFHTFVISRRNLDYIDTQPARVREWFGNKVDFRAPRPVKTAGLKLEGGRLCNMLNQRIASYMYQSDGAWVSLYIMKSGPAGIEQNSAREIVVQGYGYIDWELEGLHYSLVGDIDVDRLRQFATELQST